MAFDGVTTLIKIVEQDLMEPKLFLILDAGGMALSLHEMVEMLSDKLHFLQSFLEKYKVEADKNWARNMGKTIQVKVEDIYKYHNIESKLTRVYLADRAECVFEASKELLRTLEMMERDIEEVVVWVLVEKRKRTASLDVGSSTNALEPENEVIVGFDEDVESIIFWLTCSYFWRNSNIDDKVLKPVENQGLKLEVIPLVGEGGIGKTTLAERVYEDPIIIASFHIRARVVVSRVYNLKEMLIGLLRCISPITGEICNNSYAQIAEQLCKSLTGKKYLIFLDDIWTTIAWDAVQRCFPDNSNGSRILVTTRFIEVAKYLSANPYHVKYQNLEDCWELFSRKVFGQSHFVPKEFELIGRHLVIFCSGLPLEVLVIAGLLSTVKESLDIWRDVKETLDGVHIDDNKNRILVTLSLSYKYLPSHLKGCFHYFGVFPEDSNIPVKKLINLWVAEGFIKPHNNMSLEEVGESYLHDLINRSLVQINELSIDGKIRSCKIHDRVHEFCVSEAKKENIVCIINDNHAPETSYVVG